MIPTVMRATEPMSDPAAGLTLRDLSVGQAFETGDATITRDEIVAFARNFDPQPMHLDEESAGLTVFGRLVASGWHVAAITMRLMVESRPLGATPIIGAEVERLRFRRPVLPGTRLQCRAVVEALDQGAKPGQGYVTMTVETLDAETGSVLALQKWRLLVPSGER